MVAYGLERWAVWWSDKGMDAFRLCGEWIRMYVLFVSIEPADSGSEQLDLVCL
jgi:hypothetical protein